MKMTAKSLTCALAFLIAAALTGTHKNSPVEAADKRPLQGKAVRRALLVGIREYQSPKFPRLDYPLNDVAKLSELLETPKYGFKVTRLTDETPDKPTRDNILKAIQKTLIDDAQAGDVSLFYFSGHGSSIKNSLGEELDGRDETIVPADAIRPVTDHSQIKDIRDKELADLFNRALEKKIILTAIFDSCHSGSIARGEVQTKEIDAVDFDIKAKPTASQTVKPEERGALVLTAAKDYQRASGGRYSELGDAKYSHFTAALLMSLYQVPADLIAAEDLFQKIAARLAADARMQTPTIAGTQARLEHTVFGSATIKSTGRPRFAVTCIERDCGLGAYLQGGIADGITDGSEFRRVSAGPEAGTPVLIRVTKAGLAVSEVEVVNPTETVVPGDLFEQTVWLTKGAANLKFWLPESPFADKDIEEIKRELKILPAKQFEPEPTDLLPTNMIFFDAADGQSVWKISVADSQPKTLGRIPVASLIREQLTKSAVKTPRIFINIPPTAALRSAILKAFMNNEGRIAITDRREDAAYELAGRYNPQKGSIEYAWTLRGATVGENPGAASLPRVTDWIGSADAGAAVSDLRKLALKLSNLSGLLKLVSPVAVGSSRFPYRLEIRNSVSGQELSADGLMALGNTYDFVLRAQPGLLRKASDVMTEFTVYLMNIDSNGKNSCCESLKFGGSGNRPFDAANPPESILLASKIRLDPAGVFGTETFILLVTERPLLNSLVLRSAGVRHLKIDEKSAPDNPLADLLKNMGATITAKGNPSTSDSWVIQQIIVKSEK